MDASPLNLMSSAHGNCASWSRSPSVAQSKSSESAAREGRVSHGSLGEADFSEYITPRSARLPPVPHPSSLFTTTSFHEHSRMMIAVYALLATAVAANPLLLSRQSQGKVGFLVSKHPHPLSQLADFYRSRSRAATTRLRLQRAPAAASPSMARTTSTGACLPTSTCRSRTT